MSKQKIYGIKDPNEQGLNYLSVEVSWGSRWINLNDGEKFKINAEATRDTTAKSWRKVTADSPVLGGNYLIHAVPDMVTENISIWVYGADQTDLNDNLWFAVDLFEQFDFRVRWTLNEYREYWRCQLAEVSMARGQVWTHNQMAQVAFAVPRYPEVARERIG
jgi:hypothetical protein